MELLNFIKNNENWEEILSKKPYNLKITREDGYVLFKYRQPGSDFSIPLVREARGTIFREKDWKCVCHSFDKFGNHGEDYCPDIDWTSASVQTKVDGTLIRVWEDDGWHISTMGNIDAFKGKIGDVDNNSYGSLFLKAIRATSFGNEHIFFGCLDKNLTYYFELVSPVVKIVITYDNTEVYFLGARDMETQKEIDPLASFLSFVLPMPRRWPMRTLEEVKAAADALPWNEEGYVVCDRNFNRVKVKSPAYVQAHFAAEDKVISKEYLIRVILEGEEAEFLTYLPEYKVKIMELKEKISTLQREAEQIRAKLLSRNFDNRGAYAALIVAETKDPIIRQFCFCQDMSWEEYTRNWSAKKWSKII